MGLRDLFRRSSAPDASPDLVLASASADTCHQVNRLKVYTAEQLVVLNVDSTAARMIPEAALAAANGATVQFSCIPPRSAHGAVPPLEQPSPAQQRPVTFLPGQPGQSPALDPTAGWLIPVTRDLAQEIADVLSPEPGGYEFRTLNIAVVVEA